MPKLRLNASYITWVITANTLETIPKPILSRVQVFEIPGLSQSDTAKVAQNIYAKLLSQSKALKARFEPSLREDVALSLASLSPRRIKVLIEIGLGKAAINDRTYLTVEDVMSSNKDGSIKIGFI